MTSSSKNDKEGGNVIATKPSILSDVVIVECVCSYRGKAKLTSLQKEHDELEQKLKALREGTSFLSNLQELNTRYLKHRTAHLDEVETVRTSVSVQFGV